MSDSTLTLQYLEEVKSHATEVQYIASSRL